MRYRLPFALDDQFVILHEIKAGGFGVVYAGWDENLNLPIAVKEIHPELLQQESGLQAFQAEAQMIARLDHRGIGRLYTLKRSQGRVFMIMEYIDGGDLRQLQSYLKERGRRLSPAACLYVVREVGKALHYAHMRVDPATGNPLHLVHRDIAPSNFLVSRQGAVKLIDFGIARVAGVMRPETMGGVIKGRPQYMSPEQISAPDQLDHRSDIYSLAVVFLDMLTGSSVYGKTTNEYQLLDRVKGRQFNLPDYFAEHGLAPELLEPMERALALHAQERTATARDFVDSLDEYGKACGFDEKRAQSEVREAADSAFPAVNLRREFEDFKHARQAAETVTMQLPPQSADATRTIVTTTSTPPTTVTTAPAVLPDQAKRINVTAWVLGLIAVGFAGALVWLLTQDVPAAKDSRWQLTAEDSARLLKGKSEDSVFASIKRVEDSVAAAMTRQENSDQSRDQQVQQAEVQQSAKEKNNAPERVLPKLEREGQVSSANSGTFEIRSPVAAVISIGGAFAGRAGPGNSLGVEPQVGNVNLRYRVETGNGCAQEKSFNGVFLSAGGSFDPDTALIPAIIRFAGASRAGVNTQIRSLSANVTLEGRCEQMEPGKEYRFLPGMYEITTTAPGKNPRVEQRYLAAGKVITFQAQ